MGLPQKRRMGYLYRSHGRIPACTYPYPLSKISQDTSNAGWGAHSGQDSTRGLWSHPEEHLHINLLEMKAVFLVLQFFKKTCPHRLRQHLSGGIHQQTGRHSIGRTLCPDVEKPNMVQSEQCDTQSMTHPGITQRNSGRPLQEQPDPINRVVPLSTNLQTNFQTLRESPSGPIRNQPDHKTLSLCLSNSRPSGVGCGCPEHSMGKPGCVCFPPTALLPKVVQKLQSQICRIILITPGWPTKPWFWDLVEMSLDIRRQLPPIRTLLKQPLNNQYNANPASLNLHKWYLGVQLSKNAGSLQKWQKELLLHKESQQEPSNPQNGQFVFKNGAQRNRWTSGIHL